MRFALAASSLALVVAACDQPSPDAPDAGTSPTATAPTDTASPPPGTVPPPAGDQPPSPAPDGGLQGGTADWRQVARAEDADRIGRLDQAWRLARAEAEDRGFDAELVALGALVDPDAGLSGRLQPPPGAYRCRAIKLGTNNPGGPGYLEYPWFRCTVELTPGGDLVLTKITGSQRTRGLLYPDTDDRLVFVGAQALGDTESDYPNYGDMPVRDQAGVFERIGDNRWRLVLPWPRVDSKLEILELVR